MSSAFELIEPAGAMLSMFRYDRSRTVSSTIWCGWATFACPASAFTDVFDAVMPSGLKIRLAMKSSQDVPAATATLWPAARYITFWSSDYPHSETTFPHSHKAIARNFKGVPQAERDWILAGCAEKFFGLK